MNFVQLALVILDGEPHPILRICSDLQRWCFTRFAEVEKLQCPSQGGEKGVGSEYE